MGSFLARIAVALTFLGGLGCLAPGSLRAAAPNVEVVVEGELYASGQIAAGLDAYLADITLQGYNPVLTTTFTTDSAAADLRAHLANRFRTDGLAGAVFIGHLPVQNVYVAAAGGIPTESNACDLYFTDLDGSWTSSGAHGFLPDTHEDGGGDLGPEIWLGRLTTWNLAFLHPGRTEAGLLNDYFAKNHAYRNGSLTTPRSGLVYTDDAWDHVARAAALQLAVEDGVTDVWNDPATSWDETTAANYKWRLANETYEHILLSAHSDSTGHVMNGSVGSNELAALSPRVLFYHLFACSAAKYTDFGYIAGEYVFGEGKGLVAVGAAKTGGIMSDIMDDYFAPLGAGNNFGAAMSQWWQTAVDPGGHTAIERAWYYGMTVIGDPLLVTQPYVAGLTTLVWNGGAADEHWTQAANWGGCIPVSGKHLKFAAVAPEGHAGNWNDFPWRTRFADLTFASDAPAYVLRGNGIELAGPIENLSPNDQTIALDVELVPGGGRIDDGGRTLTLTGDLSGGGPLLKDGEGALILSGANTYTGGTVVEAGTLQVHSVNALPHGGSLTIGSGGTVLLRTGLTLADSARAASAVPEPPALVLFLTGALAVLAARRSAGRRRLMRQTAAAGKPFTGREADMSMFSGEIQT